MNKEEKKCKCGQVILENLGCTDTCHYCERKKIMEMPDKELADELTSHIFYHDPHWEIYEILRRLLLKGRR